MTSIYINATGMDKGTVAEMLKNETFMNADEAIEKGFATAKANAMAMVAVYNKQTEAIMPKEEEEKAKSFIAHIASFFKAEDKAEEVKAIDDEEEEKEMKADHPENEEEKKEDKAEGDDEEKKEDEEEEEEAKEDSEVEALKAKIEALKTELTATHEADFIAKKDQVFEAIADNKLTLAEGKNLMAESSEAITEKLSGLQANATGYGNTGKELPNKAQASKAGVYESLKGFEKTAYFNENKKDIINELKGK